MSLKETSERVCDFDQHPIPEGGLVFTLNGSLGVVQADGSIGATDAAAGAMSGDFCCMAHAIAYAQALPEFNPNPV